MFQARVSVRVRAHVTLTTVPSVPSYVSGRQGTTLRLKKRPTFTTCYNFYIHSSIATIFGTNVAEKVGNQNVGLLYFPTSPN